MGLKKKLQKQRKRVSQKLEKAAAKANAFLDDLASTMTSHSGDDIPTTITTPKKQDSPSAFYSKLDMFIDKLEQKMENSEKYDYEVENTKDESTGETTTKLVTRDKATGKIISSHTSVHFPDGTIRMTSIGEAPFVGFTSKQKMPSEIPTDGSHIEYTLRELKGGEPTVFECEVKDGPEAGKKMEYRVTTYEDGKSEYKLVKLHNPRGSTKSHVINFVLFCFLIFTMAFLEYNADLLLRSICMPIAPFSRLSAAHDMDVRFEAPWWVVPASRKSQVFSKICSGSQTAIEWKSHNAKGQLSVYTFSNTGKTTRKEKHNGLTRANFFPSEIGVVYASGKNAVKHVHWGP